jgi:hypothetical protein
MLRLLSELLGGRPVAKAVFQVAPRSDVVRRMSW